MLSIYSARISTLPTTKCARLGLGDRVVHELYPLRPLCKIAEHQDQPMSFLVSNSTACRLLLLNLVLASGPVCGQESKDLPEQNSKYAGAALCQSCHENLYSCFSKSAHVKTLKSNDPAKRGCEGCHGAGLEHATAGDPELIQRYAGMKPEVIVSRCGNCHESEISQVHIKAHLSCLTCHSIHHATQPRALLIKPAQDACRRCHTSK
jgi:predicted CXXCH cytochrome family protein